jgi:cellulose synthase (UDP-forming)
MDLDRRPAMPVADEPLSPDAPAPRSPASSRRRSALGRWIEDLQGHRAYRRFREQDDRRRRIRAQLLAVAGALLTMGYIVWLFRVANWHAGWLTYAFLAAEIVSLGLFAYFFLISWYPRFHRPDGVSPHAEPGVDVFITASGEPFAIVEATLRGAAAIAYPHKEVYVLDDGGDVRLAGLAAELGVRYLARRGHEDAKAGNLNYGLSRSRGELILTLDADQLPRPDIIRALIGYFSIPSIGLVQTRQSFSLPKGDPLGNGDPIFYGIMQAGKDTANAAFSCGSGVMYRRAALEQVGGFSTWNLVEDLHTSLNLHDAGWRSVYHDHALTQGRAPADIWSVYRQRHQWAADSLRILFWDNPLFRPGLSWLQRFQYAHLGLVYLYAGFVMPLFYVLPIIALFTGSYVMSTTWWMYALVRLPSFVVSSLAYQAQYAIARSEISFGRASNVWLGYFPAFIAATAVALTHPRRKPPYTVTGMGPSRRSIAERIVGTLPQWTLIALSLLSIPYALLRHAGGELDMILVNAAWALWTVEKLWWICLGAMTGASQQS